MNVKENWRPSVAADPNQLSAADPNQLSAAKLSLQFLVAAIANLQEKVEAQDIILNYVNDKLDSSSVESLSDSLSHS